VEEGRIADGLRLLKEAYRLNRELGDAYSTPTIVCRFGRALAAVGQAAPAARVLSSGQSLLAEMGATAPWIATSNEETLTVIHALLDDAAFAEAWEQGRSLTADEAVALALNSLD
jgi:hypothetical protein